MTHQPDLREKITRIWSQRRERYLILRVGYETSRNMLLLRSIEEIDDRY